MTARPFLQRRTVGQHQPALEDGRGAGVLRGRDAGRRDPHAGRKGEALPRAIPPCPPPRAAPHRLRHVRCTAHISLPPLLRLLRTRRRRKVGSSRVFPRCARSLCAAVSWHACSAHTFAPPTHCRPRSHGRSALTDLRNAQRGSCLEGLLTRCPRDASLRSLRSFGAQVQGHQDCRALAGLSGHTRRQSAHRGSLVSDAAALHASFRLTVPCRATIPNADDIAQWLGARLFSFDSAFRAVPLDTYVAAFNKGAQQSQFLFGTAPPLASDKCALMAALQSACWTRS